MLSALIGFIQPILNAYVPSASSDPVREHFTEGQNLLNALEDFIAAVTHQNQHAQPELLSATIEDKVDEKLDIDVAAVPVPPPITLPGDLKDQISNVLRSHVFNNMPIRVLAFDPACSEIQLIDRSEVYRRVLDSACDEASQPEFQSAWVKILNMSGSSVVFSEVKGFIERKGKEKKLVTDLIKRHAKYAILSHTWLRDFPGDVVYRDWDRRTDNEVGYNKIFKFCEVAAQNHSVSFGWMDTVCINKDSSSELDESIRSMYKWYRGAHVCVSYMSQTLELKNMNDDSWFTRGWTLQELLAPQDSHFYDMNWKSLGDIRNRMLQGVIQKATTITQAELELCGNGETFKIPISRRLQLAAKRQVTREEDTAYSLMGILGVDVSIAYGEGSEHAFFRLVRELLSSKKDVLDVFNHGYYPSKKFIPSTLANYQNRSSSFYAMEGEEKSQLSQWQLSEPISLTHMGVRIPLVLLHALKIDRDDPQCRPLGEISGTVRMTRSVDYIYEFVEPHYSLLDKRIYTGDIDNYAQPGGSGPIVATFGVMNFGIEGNNVLLPRDCLFVPLDCSTSKPGSVRPTDNFKILDISGSPIFDLKLDDRKRSVPMQELGRHGAQLLTLYL